MIDWNEGLYTSTPAFGSNPDHWGGGYGGYGGYGGGGGGIGAIGDYGSMPMYDDPGTTQVSDAAEYA